MFIKNEIQDAIIFANHYDTLHDILFASDRDKAEYIIKNIL
jgi:hypothetical protein